jgi:N-acetylglutamate synthase-like GNAT family acetyltransferase
VKLVVRQAKAGDARAICSLIRRNADAVLVAHYTPRQLDAWKRHNVAARFRKMMKGGTTLVPHRAGRLCGTIGFEGDELVGLYVNPAWRGNGIGGQLLAMVEALALKRGIASLHLCSSPGATTYYLKHGWKSKRSVVLSVLGVDFEETFMTRKLRLNA